MLRLLVTSGGFALPTYRLYRLDGAGRISGADWIDAADDDEARSKARSLSSPGGYELWERYRLVERSRNEKDEADDKPA